MKRLLIGSVALVALSLGTSAAFAAEKRVPAYTPPPPPAPAYYSWSGCYAGASAGTSSGRSDGFVTNPGSTALGQGTGGVNALLGAGYPETGSFNLSGFIGGFQAGCNWQAGMWVFGIEGDGSATNKSGQNGPVIGTIPAAPTATGFVTVNPNLVGELQERWLVTARAKLGLAGWLFGPQTMIYVTGGGAWAKIDSSLWVNGGTGPIVTGIQQSDTRTGWTVGGGLEYAVGYGWSVKGEYLYVDFGNWNTFTNCANVGLGCPSGTPTNLNVNLKDHIFRAGMNYKFW
jgi:outer membrane immunogenic protein